MPGATDFKRHAMLVDHMATTLGLDLEEQMMRGRLSLSQLEDAVLNCTGCTQPCACEQWLGAQAETAPDAPDYCRNAALFENLRDT
ncbi:hypothetical protein HC022_08370 [Salipiger sp. HF18]|uniref:DUF6455 family protein n=1 Tax=Salipiger sp. HF18 TaxID=2721557 RepID=UPI00142D3820|nr:DUF6455 family protein [Salipiger sp. HF18]NIY96262.1 hypothetical protein [Salipiger sp. HF18]